MHIKQASVAELVSESLVMLVICPGSGSNPSPDVCFQTIENVFQMHIAVCHSINLVVNEMYFFVVNHFQLEVVLDFIY